MPALEAGDLLAEFEAGRVDPAHFSHRAHVQVSFALLQRYPYPEALLHLARGLRGLAARAGRPEVYHETITAAFLAVIAERRLQTGSGDWENFAARNPDLLEKDLLKNFYDPALLRSDAARQTFILPRGGSRG